MRRVIVFISSLLLFLTACSSDSIDSIEDALDLAEDVPRKQIDTSILGVNAFANDARFGTIGQQFSEVRNTLKLGYVRLLFAWTDAVQASPAAEPDFAFYDSILAGLPPGMDALIVTSSLPGWMGNSANWIDGNPRRTLAQRWVRALVRRYGSNPKVVGFQIWNEPNQPNADNAILQLNTNPLNYLELLSLSFDFCRSLAPAKLVVSAATTSINQNFPESLNYARAIYDAGAESVLDIWGVHYYGKQFENVLQSGGVRDFLNSLSKPIWITESGAQGVNNQLAYAEQVWPFLTDKIEGIQRIYYYQFAEATPADRSYGLRTLDSSAPVSDLYVYLRDR